MNLKTQIIVEKISEDKNDSFWYHNQEVAFIELPNGEKLLAESRGEIAVSFEEDGTYYKGGQAVDKAISLGLNDLSLEELILNDRFRNNNWFAVIKINEEGEISDDLALGGSYDEILVLLGMVAIEETM